MEGDGTSNENQVNPEEYDEFDQMYPDLTPEEDEYLQLTRDDEVHDNFRLNNSYVFHDFPKHNLTFRNRYPPPEDSEGNPIDLTAIPYRTFEFNPYSKSYRDRQWQKKQELKEQQEEKEQESEEKEEKEIKEAQQDN